MNDLSVAVSPADTAQTRTGRGAENLVQKTITRSGIWAARWPLAGPPRALLFTGFAWLIIAVIVLRFTLASVTTDVLALLVAVVVGFFAHDVAGRTEQGTRAAAGATGPTAEADRMRAALLAAVSHDLRSPLAAAAAAVSCLRSPDLQLTAADRDELLTTAEESLDLLSRLAATLLDVARLQAGACLQRVRLLRVGVPIRRDRQARIGRGRAQVHAVLRPDRRRADAGLRERPAPPSPSSSGRWTNCGSGRNCGSPNFTMPVGRKRGCTWRDPGDGIGGAGAFFLLLDQPEVYGLPPDPVVTTRDLPRMWRNAALAAAGIAIAAVAVGVAVRA